MMHICACEAAILVTNMADLGGELTVINSIEVWTVNDDGLVTGLRAFYSLSAAQRQAMTEPG
jgi:hypothetical protein